MLSFFDPDTLLQLFSLTFQFYEFVFPIPEYTSMLNSIYSNLLERDT